MKDYYRIAFEAFQKDNERYWTVFNLMSIVNSGLLIFAMKSETTMVMRGGAVFGLFLCLIWALVERRYQYWVNRWQSKLACLEPFYLKEIKTSDPKEDYTALPKMYGENLMDVRYQTLKVWTRSFWMKQNLNGVAKHFRDHGISTRNAGWVIPCLFALAWIAILITAPRLEAAIKRAPVNATGTASNVVSQIVVTNYVIITNVIPSPLLPVVLPSITNYVIISNLLSFPSGSTSMQQMAVPKGSTNP